MRTLQTITDEQMAQFEAQFTTPTEQPMDIGIMGILKRDENFRAGRHSTDYVVFNLLTVTASVETARGAYLAAVRSGLGARETTVQSFPDARTAHTWVVAAAREMEKANRATPVTSTLF